MIPNEIIKKIKYLEIKTKHIVNNLFGGEYHSAFKGMGMEFADVREYILGDDVKNYENILQNSKILTTFHVL